MPGHKKKKKKKKGSIGKALAIGAGTSFGVGTAKGIVEKKIEKKLTGKKYFKGKPALRWGVARGVPGAAASVLYTLGTLKAIEAARGKKL